MRLIWTLAAVFVIDAVVPTGVAWAQISAPSHPLSWTTLGTQGGPHPNAERSQPANLLVVDGKPWLVDCGDGVLERSQPRGQRGSFKNQSVAVAMPSGTVRCPFNRCSCVTQSADSHRTEWDMANANKPACQRGRVIALWRGRATAKKAGI